METYDLIRHAVLNKQHVHGMYNGYYREMCPHVIGTKRGRQQALCYQFGGDSSSGLAPAGSPTNWRCVIIDKLTDVQILDGEWHTGTNHTRPQTCVDEIDVEVAY